MKSRDRKIALLASALALAALLVAPATLHGAQGKGGGEKSEKKSGTDAETLRKYDRNGNGRLDPNEEAAMRADEARVKREKEKKKG